MGFSLIELLVALSILAIVAAIVVPRFLNVRQDAELAVMNQNLSELNSEYYKWMNLGGVFNPQGYWDSNFVAAIMITYFLGDSSTQSAIAQQYGINAPSNIFSLGLSGATLYPTGTQQLESVFGYGTPETSAPGLNATSPDGIYLVAPAGEPVAYYKVGNLAYEFSFSTSPNVGFSLNTAAPVDLSQTPFSSASGY